jgi:hypothetical protein
VGIDEAGIPRRKPVPMAELSDRPQVQLFNEQTVRKRGFAVSPALSIGTGALIAHSERAIRFEKDLSRDVMSQTSRI